MESSNIPFEVEIRFYFYSYGEAYKKIPFLQACLQNEDTWITTFYGHELFKSGQLLRIGNVYYYEGEKWYLDWKGPDVGEFANIRQELVEDITAGIVNSAILKIIGGNEGSKTPNEVINELHRLGHYEFMLFRGRSNIGRYEPSRIDVKLMFCPMLKYPLMVEFEKTAATEEEAKQCESELLDLSKNLGIQERLVKEEPPTLLYAMTFSEKGEK